MRRNRDVLWLIVVLGFLAIASSFLEKPEEHVDEPQGRHSGLSINYLDRSNPSRPFFCIVDSFSGVPNASYSLPEPHLVDRFLVNHGGLPYSGLRKREISEEEVSELVRGLELHGARSVKTEKRLNTHQLQQAYLIFIRVGDINRTIRLSHENPDNSDLLQFIRGSVIGRIKNELYSSPSEMMKPSINLRQ